MNLALHRFLLHVFLLIFDFQYGILLCSAGEPGYLDFDNLPETNFSCQGKVIGGYYADVEAGCQMFHVCTIGQKDEIMDIKFLCLNGTVFDQETRVCERVDEVDCSKSERFYNLNLELYGNNAVTLSLHETDDEDPADSEDHQLRTTSARPTTITTTSTTSRPLKPSTTVSSSPFQHPTVFPQHYQPQSPFPQVHTSQSKSLYDDKNGGYHHQYIFHNGERNDNQATSYQLFSNQGVSSTTVQVPIHQVRYSSSTSPRIIHNEPSTVAPIYHPSSTLQTLLNSNANNPALINPIFHNHGIASTTEQFSIHSNNPRETSEYRDNIHNEQNLRPLEAVQSTNKGKVSQLTISPVPTSQEPLRTVQTKVSQSSQQRSSSGFLPTPSSVETTIRSFYPTPKNSAKPSTSSTSSHVTQHIHIAPPIPIPQLKPHQITINLPPPDIQKIVQNPSPLLPSQSRVIVTAKASVSDESGRPLNTTQLVTLPLPTIPASYDDYKEGDESFDPFYRDVPKIRNDRRRRSIKDEDEKTESKRRRRSLSSSEQIESNKNNKRNKKNHDDEIDLRSLSSIQETLKRFRQVLFNGESGEDFDRRVHEYEKSREELIHSRTENSDSKEDAKELKNFESNNKTRRSMGGFKDEHADRNSQNNKIKAEEEQESRTDEEIDRIDISNVPEVKSSKSDISEDTDSSPILNNNEEQDEDSNTDDIHQDPEVVDLSPLKNLPQRDSKLSNINDSVLIDRRNGNKVYKASYKGPNVDKTTTNKNDLKIDEAVDEIVENTKNDLKTDETADPLEKNLDESSEDKEILSPNVTTEESHVKEPEEVRYSARKKDSKPRSTRRRISARRKQHKERTERVEETTDNNEEETILAPVAKLEIEIGEQINSNIFDEPESQTSKELDTRAVGHHDTKYFEIIQDKGKNDLEKDSQKHDTDDRQSSKKHSTNLEETLHDNNKNLEDEGSITTQTNIPIDINLHVDEESENAEDKLVNRREEETSSEIESSSENKKDLAPKNISKEQHEIRENVSIMEVTEEYKEEIPTNISSTEMGKHSREEKTRYYQNSTFTEITSNNHNKHEEGLNEESDSEDYSIKHQEEIRSVELSSEYHDFAEESYENIEEIGAEDEYKDSENPDDTTVSAEYSEETDSREISREISAEKPEENPDVTTTNDEETTEGILKFTDELPQTDKYEETTKKESTTESKDSIQDYVDDNYEPVNYKEQESAVRSEDADDEAAKKTKDKEEEKKIIIDDIEEIEEKIEDNVETQDSLTESDYLHHDTSIPTSIVTTMAVPTTTWMTPPTTIPSVTSTTTPIITETTPLTSTSASTSTMASTTISTTTSTTTSTTSTTETITIPTTTPTMPPTTVSTTIPTTTRPTPPKLFKPISARRNYNYIPPTTTPIPVVIKPRFGLYNPKPAKPPKSYNELVPKPVIRKLTLPTRKIGTIFATTSTEKAMSERNFESSTEVITTESSRSEENILESNLKHSEASVPNKTDQLTNSSDKKIINASLETTETISSKDSIQNFTPYPLSKIASTVTTAETFATSESELVDLNKDTVTVKTPSLIDIITTHTPIVSITLVPTSSKNTEIDNEENSSTPSEILLEQSTVSSSTPGPSTIPDSTENQENVENTESSTTVRTIDRKPPNLQRHASFNCLEKEMYRFYGDTRDCRLFHYCSPGFTSRQVLDFRFVCEEGTIFDEETQSCRHDVRNRKCLNRPW